MCGIGGIISLTQKPIKNARAKARYLLSALHHRGPDDRGYFVSPSCDVLLVNTRLSIVGTDEVFPLPMSSKHKNTMLAFNGEIYDFAEQREALGSKGVTFKTKTDTEVLLNGLDFYGPSYLSKLDGFWSFAYADFDDNTVILARDLMGEKPLYYCDDGDFFYFSSEIKPLLSVMGCNPNFDINSIATAIQYRAPRSGETLLEGVSRLRGGQGIKIDVSTGSLELFQAQSLGIEPWLNFFSKNPDLEDILEVYSQEIGQSIRRRLPREVAFQATLSGGIDSTLINCFLREFSNGKISSLHVHSQSTSPKRGEDLSEYDAAKFTADALKIDLLEESLINRDTATVYSQCAQESFDGILCEGVADFRQLARFTRENGCKVLVLSDGPDELLGGYDVDLRVQQLQMKLRNLPQESRSRLVLRAFDHEHMRNKSQSLTNWAYQVTEPFAVRPNHSGTTINQMHNLFAEKVVNRTFKAFGSLPAEYDQLGGRLDCSQKAALGYATSSIPDYINTRSDRASMAESIEARLPLMAPNVAALMVATPQKYRCFSSKLSKYLLRELVRRRVGPEVALRQKYGFATPAWKAQTVGKELRMRETVMDCSMFTELPFKKSACHFVTQAGNERLLWMFYCLAKTWESYQDMRHDT
jgi:asparagine synthase (glutamine-hydrolysing)